MRRVPLIAALMLLAILTLSPATNTSANTKDALIASPTNFAYRMTPGECLILIHDELESSYELCPGDTVTGTEVSKAYVRGQMATFMNSALGQTLVIIEYENGPTPSGADYYLLTVFERLF